MVTNYSPVEGAVPEPSKFGLLNPKTLVSDDERWGSGIAIDSLACNVETRIVEICDPSNVVTITEPGENSNLYRPYVIQSEYKCSTFGFNANNYFEKATLGLELCQNKAAEHEFWTGEMAQLDNTLDAEGLPNSNQYLASPDAEDVTPTPGTAVKPAYGQALLEQALADCGCGARGYIHATRAVASTLPVKEEDGLLQTKLGTYVIAGTGYDGSGPDGTQPGGTETWMYATGPVTARLGAIAVTPETLSEATDVRNNEVSVMASREAAVTWDGCCHFAVLVDLSLDYS